MKEFIKKFIPSPLLSGYHLTLAYIGALAYGFPSRKLVVIAVTGTKGKTSTTELIARLLRVSGIKTASTSTIQFCIGDTCERNLYKMTMPGRFFLQKFLRRAVAAGCTHAVIEMSSEAVKQFRHKGVQFDALVFTNLAPEHIESHGSFEKYAAAKLSLAQALAESPKRPRIVAANADDAYGQKFLDFPVEKKAAYSLRDAEPYTADDTNIRFTWRNDLFSAPLPGVFNLYNCLAALSLGEALGLERGMMKRALEHMPPIAGRAERVAAGQPFDVIVDYAHTMESLRALYSTFSNKPASPAGRRIIAIIGATGGGRDKTKRAERGALAEQYAALTFITNEDPYDEDPLTIMQELSAGFKTKKPQLISNRRTAIYEALKAAKEGDVVLITGKGTDPYIMGARGTKEPWSDAAVAKEELQKLGYGSNK